MDSSSDQESRSNSSSPQPEDFRHFSTERNEKPSTSLSKTLRAAQCRELMKACNQYCQMKSKELDELTLSDCSVISRRLMATPEACFTKLKHILLTGNVLCNYWTKREDILLLAIKDQEADWKVIANILNREIHNGADLRNARQCRNRWKDKLDPRLRHDEQWSVLEDIILLEQYEKIGQNWQIIGNALNGGRTKREIMKRLKDLKNEARFNIKNFGDINAGLKLLLKEKREIQG
jgi:hypothetical protein